MKSAKQTIILYCSAHTLSGFLFVHRRPRTAYWWRCDPDTETVVQITRREIITCSCTCCWVPYLTPVRRLK